MKKIPKRYRGFGRLLGLSPWILGVACILLLLVLAFFAVSNFRREKLMVREALVEKSHTIIRYMNSTIRRSFRGGVEQPPWILTAGEVPQLQEQFKEAITLASEQPGVDYLVLTKMNGQVIYGAGTDYPQSRIAAKSIALLKRLEVRLDEPFVHQMEENSDGKKHFMLATHFQPSFLPDKGGRRNFMMGPMRHRKNQKGYGDENELPEDVLLFIRLNLDQFSGPLRSQYIQIALQLLTIFLVGLGGTLSFITLRNYEGSEKSLGAARVFTDHLVQSLPIGLLATDENRIVQICNDVMEDLLELEGREVVGRAPHLCLMPKLAAMFRFSLDAETWLKDPSRNLAGERGTGHEDEVWIELGSGIKKFLHLSSFPLLSEDNTFAGELLLVRDLTKVKSLEKELRRSERLAALGKMAAGVAHELRNPLSSIKGLALLLQSSSADTEKRKETADVLVKEVERLNRAIGELLDYARPMQLYRQDVDVEEMVRQTALLVEADASAYGVEIDLQFEQKKSVIPVDRDKIQQVLLNLFLNSLQAMSAKGKGKLTIGVEDGDSGLVIAVHDNGEGVEPEIQQKVFDPYFTTKNDGTGLGLAISAKIVEEHGGRMDLKSLVGEYTEIAVHLPRNQALDVDQQAHG